MLPEGAPTLVPTITKLLVRMKIVANLPFAIYKLFHNTCLVLSLRKYSHLLVYPTCEMKYDSVVWECDTWECGPLLTMMAPMRI